MNKNGRKILEIDIASLGGHVYSKKQVGWPVKAISLHFLLSPICQAYCTLAHLLVYLAGLPIWLPSLFASTLFLGAQVIVSNKKYFI